MKKKLALSLAFAFTMGVAGTAFADSNPFVDVPSKHWSYDAVSKLAKDGIIDGYANKTFQGDKTLTRYEMAQAVAKAVGKADKASAEDKALIQKLYTEYKDELKGMNVRVSALEGDVKDLKDSKVTFTGQIRASYQKHTYGGVNYNGYSEVNDKGETVQKSDGQNRFLLCLEGIVKVNDNWTAHIYNETSQYFGHQIAKGSQSDNEADGYAWRRAWVSGKVGSVNLDLGKKWYCYGYNTAVGTQGTGFSANIPVASNLTADVFYVKPEWGQNDFFNTKLNMYGVHFNYAVSKDTNISLLVGGNDKNPATSVPANAAAEMKSWGEIGFDTKLSQDFKLTAAYGKTNANKDNRNIYARLDYKGVDQSKAGSYGIYARYFDRQKFGDPCGDNEDGSLAAGVKTYGIGVEYAVAKNIVWQNLYYKQKANDGSDKSGNIYRTHLDFHF